MPEGKRHRWIPFRRDRSSKERGIVVVHGLNGHREKTWTASNGVHWARDLLPIDIPNARILSWGYDANTHGNRVSCMYLYDHARQLVSDLCLKRNLTQTSTRPIIFVAHSLGGIVVKSALIHADAARDGALTEHRSIKTSTYGIIFIGTPHQGGSDVQLGKLLVNVVSVFVAADTRLLQHLERDSEWLQQQLGQYGPISGDFVTKFAYEVYKTPTVMGHSLLVVPRASAVVPGAANTEPIAIYADHLNMVKFASKDDSAYRTVVGHLQLMVRDADSTIRARWEAERRVNTARLGLDADTFQAVFIVPFNRNDQFVGRKDMLAWLDDRIHPSRAKDRCQRTMIQGLGGIGKTQLALEAVFQIRDKDPGCSVFWVPMVSVASFDNAYREIGRQLRVPEIDEEKADVKSLVKNALDGNQYGPWLLVLDNADDVELLFGEARLCDWMPTGSRGSILMTTRFDEVRIRLDTHPKHSTLVVTEMNDQDAVRLLTDRLSSDHQHKQDDVMAICQMLASLPLALKQAAAYMETTGISAAKYLAYLQASDDELIKLLGRATDVQTGRYNKGVSNSVATTWLISFEHIARDRPLAAELLRTTAWVVEKDIPISMLLRDKLDEMEMDEAIGTLRNYAFVNLHEDGTSFDVHRLVQIVTRNWIRQQNEESTWVRRVVGLLADAYPSVDYENFEVWQRYLPHAARLKAHAERATEHAPEIVTGVDYEDLLNILASSSSYHGKYAEAEKMQRERLELTRQRLGNNHPRTLDSMHGLAREVRKCRRYKEAEKMYRELIGLQKQHLADDHPLTLNGINSLAEVLRYQRKYTEAEQTLRPTIDQLKQQLGADHPSVLCRMNNLAVYLQDQHKITEAEQIHRQILEVQIQKLGIQHPDTLRSMNNLGNDLRKLGRHVEAEEMLRQSLDLKKQHLGADHPSVLARMDNLAYTLERQGKYMEAEKLHAEIIHLTRQRFGEDHPDTLRAMKHLARVLQHQGKDAEAEEIRRNIQSQAEMIRDKG